ncbi:guanine nucleotide exchange factor [Seminavis robusta]|uniref:Guanine nucleotide exchange factor n=1 Tax=Seminavis robusta TaxID=568900 RepID=A0A9N8HDV6_9STRA|nr:guanine nucleotide exchange factor [Seminavis robusta]|eukprot:Sro274_g105410.1 guanine nucleotide exchange factor (630) ;mRNA; f:35529-37532
MESSTSTTKEAPKVDSQGDSSAKEEPSPRMSAIVMADTMNLLEDPTDSEAEKKPKSSSKSKSKTKTGNKKSSRTSSSNSSTGEAVSVERKEQLLLEARVNRLQWIHQVPLPYRKAESPDDPWVQEKGLASFLKNCHAAALMPSMTKALSHLYGMEDQRVSPEDVANRIETLIGSLDDDEAPHSFVRPGKQLLEAEIAKSENNLVLTGYRDFWIKLQTPECASLVQGMRTAVRNMDSIDEPRSLEEIAERMKSYLNGTFESIKAHAAWKHEGVNDRLKHSLESFVYGQCHSLLQVKLWTDETRKSEEEWMERLAALQFVTPQHLDIACLETSNTDLKEALAEPMEALLSADLYFSPYEKLQRILAMYHGVNTALSKALNVATVAGKEKKMASADDVLPTIILTVLKSKPARIHANLRMVELFCPPEYLRGEAGYACTNLFGAVQFLLDLDMENPKSLSIDADEFRKGLAASRAKFKERLDTKRKRAQLQGPTIDTDISLKYCDIPASEIRTARANGDQVDLDWALAWQQDKLESEKMESGQSSNSAEDVLPPGFSRNYTFLTSRPEDIRMSDLPQLLSEYRMLVHTSETLLGERASRLAAERKKKVNIVQEELLKNIQSVDPSLLPDTSM